MKTIFTIAADDLIARNAKFTPAVDRADNGVDVVIPLGTIGTISALRLECTQYLNDADMHEIHYETFSDAHAVFVSEKLQKSGLPFTVTKVAGQRIEIKILDLLDSHWMLFQLIDQPKLRITSTEGHSYTLDFHNNGHHLWASFDATGENVECGSELMQVLKEMHTKHEVQG